MAPCRAAGPMLRPHGARRRPKRGFCHRAAPATRSAAGIIRSARRFQTSGCNRDPPARLIRPTCCSRRAAVAVPDRRHVRRITARIRRTDQGWLFDLSRRGKVAPRPSLVGRAAADVDGESTIPCIPCMRVQHRLRATVTPIRSVHRNDKRLRAVMSLSNLTDAQFVDEGDAVVIRAALV